MQIFIFAAIILIAWWFKLSAGIIAIVAISFFALQFWLNSRATRMRSSNQQEGHDTSGHNSNHSDSFATAVIANSYQHEASLNNNCDAPSDSSGSSSDSSSCSYDSGSSDSGGSSSSSD